MIPLDYNAVVEDFIKMADIEETEVLRFEVTIDECINKVQRQVDVETVAQQAAAQHLAACEALYEAALIRDAGDRAIMTADGRAGGRLESRLRVEAAKELLDAARARAADLFPVGVFVFRAI